MPTRSSAFTLATCRVPSGVHRGPGGGNTLDLLGSTRARPARVPGQAVAKLQSRDSAVTVQRAQNLGWAVRQRAGQLSCLLPHPLSLREVVDALDGPEVSAVSVQAVTLEDAYLELVGEGAALE